MLQIRKHIIIVLFCLIASYVSIAQPAALKADTTKKNNNGLKSYSDIITSKALSDGGMIWVHKVDDKYFFEIPDSVFGREILVVNRLSKSAAGLRVGGFFGYAGDDINSNVIRFEKGPNNKIFVRSISFAEYTKDSTSSMHIAVKNSNVQPIAASFEIKSTGRDSAGAVIDVTDYANGDNEILHFSNSIKSFLRIGAIQNDKSYIVSVKSFPVNVEIRTVKTYGRMPALSTLPGGGVSGGAAGGNLTVELNSSLVLLPKVPMQSRYFDPRVGYFTTGYTDYDENPQGIKRISMIKRWRLEPKPEDMPRYLGGELVEPQKPIVFYIDPATPKKWVPYLMQGVDDWKIGFEKAGFKNAIMAKLAPTKEEDSTWSLDDARNSAIVYKPSDIANASGPSISDPRSGEIIESHINWYHNVMSLLRDWYFIQAAAIDPAARKMVFDDELMGQLIRFVSSHEVGHTLGLRHNHGSSSTVPVEKLRDKAWVEANGHTPSIMDYARFNYVAQPEDNVGRAGIFPRIGDYDKWALEWGYKLFPQYKTAQDEKSFLNKWVIEKLKDKRLWFGTESNPDDPRSQSEQIGDDAMKGSYYGIKNLQRIVPNLKEWTKVPNEDYSSLRNMYYEITNQYQRYIGHVIKYIGGIMETPKMVEESGPVYENVSKEKQKEAVDFLNKQLFTTPVWLLNQEIFDNTGLNGLTTIGRIQDYALSSILRSYNLSKLLNAEASSGNKAYLVTELLSDLKKGIWTELAARKPIDIFRRQLQKSYINTLSSLIKGTASAQSTGSLVLSLAPTADKSDIGSVVKGHLSSLRSELLAALSSVSDIMTKYHLQDIAKSIDNMLNPRN